MPSSSSLVSSLFGSSNAAAAADVGLFDGPAVQVPEPAPLPKSTARSRQKKDDSSSSDNNNKRSEPSAKEDRQYQQDRTVPAQIPHRTQYREQPPQRQQEQQHQQQQRRGEDGKDSKRKKEAGAATDTNRKKRKNEDAAVKGDDNDDDVVYGPPEEDRDGDDDKKEGGAGDADARTVFVGNLPAATTRKSLAKLFAGAEGCGKVESARIRGVAISDEGVKLPPQLAGRQDLVRKVCCNTRKIDSSRKPSAHGYVVFASAESVEAALLLNNTEIEDDPAAAGTGPPRRRRIRVDLATPTYDAQRSVFVGNLPYGADEGTLQEHFCRGCDLQPEDVDNGIEAVRVVRDPETFQCRGFGYVLFRDRATVATALQRMNGSKYQKRELRVKVCGRRFKGRRGGEQQQQDKQQPPPPTLGALKRVLTKQVAGESGGGSGSSKNRRVRGDPKKNRNKSPAAKASVPGVSKRAAAERKAGMRAKKIQKRITKGMGKQAQGK